MRSILLANTSGFWGDNPDAFAQQVNGELPIDYAVSDYLAEITMSMIQKIRQRGGDGYVGSFLVHVDPVLEILVQRGIKVVTNAGGLDPAGLAEKLQLMLAEKNLTAKIGVIEGDDLVGKINSLYSEQNSDALKNMDTGASFSTIHNSVVAANVYIGTEALLPALQMGAQIVVAGRATDTSVSLAPMMHEFGWKPDDYNKLAAGIVAGHILECGPHAVGGNFTDHHDMDAQNFAAIAHPIVEMFEDGTFIVTKHPNTGGKVTVDTVREQLFYEMGDPRNYISPDCVVDFTSIRLEDAGIDRVRVFGIKGRAPTESYKVSIAYQAGWKLSQYLWVKDARSSLGYVTNLEEKVRATVMPEDLLVEYLLPANPDMPDAHELPVMLRMKVKHRDKRVSRIFSEQLNALITGGVPATYVEGGKPKIVQEGEFFCADGALNIGGGIESLANAQKTVEILKSKMNVGDESVEVEYFRRAPHDYKTVNAGKILVRVAAFDTDKGKIADIGSQISSLMEQPLGISYDTGKSKPTDVVSYWPALIPKCDVEIKVTLRDGDACRTVRIHGEDLPFENYEPLEAIVDTSPFPMKQPSGAHRFRDIALARSGDKGDSTNIGVLARTEEAYHFLRGYLTAQRVKEMFPECKGVVRRYEVPGLLGLNFILQESLGGGGTRSLLSDNQGKGYAQRLLDHVVNLAP